MTVLSPSLPHAAGIDAALVENPWLGLRRSGRYFQNAETEAVFARALGYARAGVCVHLAGPAGLGKTTLALRIAQALGRPVAFMTGNEWLGSRDFIGGEIGQTVTSVVDRYIQSVRRTEQSARIDWKESILGQAMRCGHTFLYDEFTRASPEANAALLSVLEEGVLVSTDGASRQHYIEAHPDFRVLLTSNPHDYRGVKAAPDALIDRMVTLRLEEPSAPTLAGIVALRSGLDPATARRIVELVLSVQRTEETQAPPSMRTAILMARLAAPLRLAGRLSDAALAEIAADVLRGRGLEADAVSLEAKLATPMPGELAR